MVYTTRSLGFLLAALLSAPFIQASVLHADGIIRVKGDGWRGTRVTVVPEFSQPYDVDMKAPRFVLHLPLQSTYLIRAEHADCPTKEVVFDLRVPAAAMAQEYEFPFEIILEMQPAGVELRYAGPVGLVSFDKNVNDFDYITDHRLIALLPKADELRERAPAELHPQMRSTDVSTVTGTSGSFGSVIEAEHVDPAQLEPTTLVAASVLVGTPIPVDPITTTGLSDQAKRADHSEAVPPTPTLNVSTTALDEVAPGGPAEHMSTSVALVSLPAQRRIEPAPKATATHGVLQEEKPLAPCGTDETITSGRMVIHTQRIPTADGGCQELRTVTHAYGAVFHFHDGRPVTEAFFNIVSAGR